MTKIGLRDIGKPVRFKRDGRSIYGRLAEIENKSFGVVISEKTLYRVPLKEIIIRKEPKSADVVYVLVIPNSCDHDLLKVYRTQELAELAAEKLELKSWKYKIYEEEIHEN